MGNSESSSQQKEFEKNYVKHSDEKDGRFGRVTYYHNVNKPSDMVMLKHQWTNSLIEENNFNNILNTRQNIQHPNLAPMKSYIESEDKHLTSTFHKHALAFEY
jgi:hypothetical protein